MASLMPFAIMVLLFGGLWLKDLLLDVDDRWWRKWIDEPPEKSR